MIGSRDITSVGGTALQHDIGPRAILNETRRALESGTSVPAQNLVQKKTC
jgi:hypothetical protein